MTQKTPALLNPLTHSLHKAVFQMDKIADLVLQKNLHLTFSQFRILLVINSQPQASQAAIAKYHGLTAAAVSRQIDILKVKKLLAVKVGTTNRRQHLLLLTPVGKQLIHKALKLIDSTFLKIYHILSQDEKKIITTSLNKIVNLISSKGITYFCENR